MKRFRRVAFILGILTFVTSAAQAQITITSIGGEVHAMAMTASGHLYVGGNFTNGFGHPQIDYIARWDGKAWSPVGGGLDGPVYALAARGNDLYVGGEFKYTGSKLQVNNFARWDGVRWNTIGNGPGTREAVYALKIDPANSNIYVGGKKQQWPDQNYYAGAAYWSGSEWRKLGHDSRTSFESRANVVNLWENNLIAGCGDQFTMPLQQFNGEAWEKFRPWGNQDHSYEVNALAPATEGLYVGGVFRINVGKDGLDRPVYACGLVRHDGTNWNSVGGDFFTNNHGGTYREDCYGEGLSLGVKALVRAGGNLFVGGSFLDQKNNYLNKFAMWNGQTWSTLGVKLGGDETVNAILISGGNIFIAGKFSDAGGNPNADYIAYYSSSTRRWNAVYPAAAKPTPTPTFRPPAPQPPSSRDTTRPQVTAYQAKGRAGAVMRFVYSVYDNSGVTREEIVVYRKAREIARISQGFSALPRTGVRRVRYSARGMKKGRMTYCVEAIDPSGNADRSCANLRLKKRRR